MNFEEKASVVFAVVIEAETSSQLYFQVRAVDQEALAEYPPVFLQEQVPPDEILSTVQVETARSVRVAQKVESTQYLFKYELYSQDFIDE